MTENSANNLETTSSVDMDEDILPGYKTVADFTKDGFKCLMEGIKHANSLPTGRDWNFYMTFESFAKVLNEESNQIMDGITSVLRKNEVGANMRNQTTEKKTEILIDANDLILERVANNIDEMNGIKKIENEPVVLHAVSAQLPVNINGSWNRSSSAIFSVSTSISPGIVPKQSKDNTIRLLTAENIIRPQKIFKDKIDNRNDYPWEPKIKEKPNSIKPLAIFLEESENGRQFSHPYEYELDRFTPSESQLNKTKVNKPKLLKDTPLVEINDPTQLPELVEELRKYKMIAIDLEHHSYRSFMGITCLMQISTFDKDYLIDTLKLRNDLCILNEVFTKPDIIKIFHGADSDILWLQRDLSLYIVNMFDTYFAAKQLEYSGLSLAYLMQRFCNFMPNKHFQLADWRIRPLPEELKNYAREDTHYLIHIYQNMRNELIDKANGKSNLLKAVIDTSTTLCKKKYCKPFWHENSHLDFYRKCYRTFDNRQLFALKYIYQWRDNIARVEDESVGYVLPNNMLLEIAGRLPKEMQGILACCSPVPPLVRANLLEIHKIILKALERPFEEPILKEDTRARGSTKKMTKIDVDSPLHCPHDLTRNGEFRDDLPTLLNSVGKENIKDTILTEFKMEQKESVFSVFNSPKSLESEKEKRADEKLRKFRENFKFLGPFERYKLVKPFIQAKEKKLAEERAKEEEENAKKQIENKGKSVNVGQEEKRLTDEQTMEGEIQAGNRRNNAVVDEDNRTDEERIESIREHFLLLARKALPTKPELPKKVSLLEMGGSKKRKRDESILRGNLHSDYDLPENNLHTPIPNLHITLHTNINKRQLNEDDVDPAGSRKRKSSDGDINPGPSKFPKFSRREKNKMRMVKRKQKKAIAISCANESLGVDESIGEGSSSFQTREQNPSSSTRGSPKRKNGRGGKSFRGRPQNRRNDFKGKTNQQRETAQPGDFNAYDYSMVDFRQFQGGARGVDKSKEFKAKFKGKGRPNKRGGKNQNNKAMTFGRGRGR